VSAAHSERDVIPLLEPLHRRAIRMTSAPADAEDLLQETVLKAYAGRHSFQPRTNLKAWLFRIMTNTYISGYRAKKRQPAQYPTDQITDQQLVASAVGRASRRAVFDSDVVRVGDFGVDRRGVVGPGVVVDGVRGRVPCGVVDRSRTENR
jgi:RNA polymerase sigma factor (sigma-70 family)